MTKAQRKLGKNQLESTHEESLPLSQSRCQRKVQTGTLPVLFFEVVSIK